MGLGYLFLVDLSVADGLIFVIDVSGSTNIEGVPGKPGDHDPREDVEFLKNEIDMWIREILKDGFNKMARTAKMTGAKPEALIYERLAGLKITESQVKRALMDINPPNDPTKWDDEIMLQIAKKVREYGKPMIVAMNKADIAPEGNIELIQKINDMNVVTMAETELALKKAAEKGVVEYVPGDSTFTINTHISLNEPQKKALEYMKENIEKYGGTGVQTCLEKAAFDMLDLITVYPVEDENKYTDHFGRVLPDAYLLPRGSTARDLAYKVHTDLGEKFIRAVNAKTKRTVGADYELLDGDVIRIVANK